MVVLRLKRFGRTHRPFYRMCVMDRRAPRNGKVIEELGWFDPLAADDRRISVATERVGYWLSVGAQPSDTVRDLLRSIGCEVKAPKPRKARAKPRGATAKSASTKAAKAKG